MVSDAALESLDAILSVNMAASLAGLSLVAFTFLSGRVRELEQETGLIKVKRGAGDQYAKSLLADMMRMRFAARMVLIATIALFVSAILMLVAFDTFAESSAASAGGPSLWDAWLTGATFLFGLIALLLATVALGWDYLVKQ